MFQVTIDGEAVNASVTFYTAVIYEQEFGRDMLKEFFGVQALKEPMSETDGVVEVDFTQVNWLASSKVLWAAIKTADDSVEPYSIWVKSAAGANMWLINDVLGMEISDCFFRTEAPAEGGAEEGQG